MNGDEEKIRKSNPEALGRLLDVPRTREIWDPKDLRGVFEHQLATAILYDARRVHPELGRRAQAVISDERLTFGEVLQDHACSREVLELIKDFAKLHWHGQRSGVPKEIMIVLYYTAIAAALVFCSAAISQLSDESLRGGMEWVLDQAWAPGGIHEINRAAIEKLRTV